ncbi:HSPB1-associated protein 1 homolog isoform X3 [Brienomyrus brachyistius]|uniref:HSPB1-associated protein 1 homolog isoform X3 n=1 Tax=Brienomyrus brachyistius TaxID=42636 RepID=UPI0020B429D2|nr:HSPB1-associated protein 1 homolog isoform X3 [Brienomyrus brachyistius]
MGSLLNETKLAMIGIITHRLTTAMEPKPFTPEEARQILESLEKPAVFLDMTAGWPSLGWTAEHLAHVLGEKTVQFRVGKRQDDRKPLFETQCSYVEATVWEFLSWTKGQGPCPGPFSDFPRSEYWAYADYKYIAVLFQHKPAMFQDVPWSDFGFPGRNGRESTLWVGSDGANTPCHQDTYGCNLVLQVQGRKKWYLFPVGDTCHLYPTRIPYEESSVFSQVDITRPDMRRFPAFARARAHVVTLQPGQVLFVPRHWWHYVESLDPVTVSINSWIEMEADDTARVGEALTRTVVCALKTLPSPDNVDEWLNPTEVDVPTYGENLRDLSLAVQACTTRRGGDSSGPVKRDAQGLPKHSAPPAGPLQHCPPDVIPFGPHLVPVGQESADASLDEGPQSVNEEADKLTEVTGPRALSTNDLLEALVHPDVIALAAKLIVGRHGCG